MIKLVLTIEGEKFDYDIIKDGATFGEQISLLPFDTEIKKLIRELGEKENEKICSLFLHQ